MVGGDDGVARVQQGVHDGTQICQSLGIVGVPGAAVDVDDDRIEGFLHPGQVDVQLVIHLAVSGIVDVLEGLGAMDVDFGHLEAAESAGGLGLEGQCARQAEQDNQYFFHPCYLKNFCKVSAR